MRERNGPVLKKRKERERGAGRENNKVAREGRFPWITKIKHSELSGSS